MPRNTNIQCLLNLMVSLSKRKHTRCVVICVLLHFIRKVYFRFDVFISEFDIFLFFHCWINYVYYFSHSDHNLSLGGLINCHRPLVTWVWWVNPCPCPPHSMCLEAVPAPSTTDWLCSRQKGFVNDCVCLCQPEWGCRVSDSALFYSLKIRNNPLKETPKLSNFLKNK